MREIGLFIALTLALPALAEEMATGVVFEDLDRDRVRGAEEPGIEGVRVSNGVDIVATDAEGKWSLPVLEDSDDGTTFFVIKPADFMTPTDENRLPKFYYVHKPDGSPKFSYPTVEPTGPLPESIDFPLYRRPEPRKFRIFVFGDTQPDDIGDVDFIAEDVIPELVGFPAAFGMTLGDIVNDKLELFEPLNQVQATLGVPWYNVIGNHDINYDSPNDQHSDETYTRVYGPATYAFDYGDVHFVVLDDVFWNGSRYTGRIGERQLKFLHTDLADVPKDRLVVLTMHIPLVGVDDRKALFAILQDRPNTLSLSAHYHYQRHVFFGKDEGWNGRNPHHHLIAATVCGGWLKGLPDEQGIPHSTMRDGAPNGVSIVSFDGSDYVITFKPARRPSDHQIMVYVPNPVPQSAVGSTKVIANVFAGSEKSVTEMRLADDEEWIPMTRFSGKDPYYVALTRREKILSPLYPRPLPGPTETNHLWRAELPAGLEPGYHLITVRTTDMFGQVYLSRKLFRVAN